MRKVQILLISILITLFVRGRNLMAGIDPLSLNSLFLILQTGECAIGTATGFVIEKDGVNYLITNWHVLSGRHPKTNNILHHTGAVPREVLIWHHAIKLGGWHLIAEKLYNESGEKCWKEHKNGREIDIVALPLENIPDIIQLYPFDLSLADADIRIEMAMPVSIIGFPLGFSGGGMFPIWKTGHVASEPDIDYNGKPMFLIDATTRGGMSGSPVVLRPRGGHQTKKGVTKFSSGSVIRFIGIYSGRLPGDTEIGIIWKPHLIEDILNKE